MSDERAVEGRLAGPWAWCPNLGAGGRELELSAEESRHLAGSRRLRAGDSVVLFDGCGGLAGASVLTAPKRGAVQVLAAAAQRSARRGPEVHLAFALPKGGRLSTLLDMVAQLGVASLRPLNCERSISRWKANKEERSQRLLIESCKQSRQAHLPELLPESSPLEAAQWGRDRGLRVLLAHPGEGPMKAGPGLVLLGPEGGFSVVEVSGLVKAGAEKVSLGAGILRIETAAVAASAALRFC